MFVFVLKLKVIPLFNDLRQKRWDHTQGTKKLADSFLKEADEIDIEWKKLLDDGKKKSNDILSKSDSEAKLIFAEGRSKFLQSVSKRIEETRSKLSDQEYKIKKNIIDGIKPLTVDMVIKTSGGVLSRDRVENHLKNNFSSLKKTLDLRD